MRLRVFSRAAAWRLGVLFAALGAGAAWSYVTMIRMPGKSFAGALQPADAPVKGLAERLQADVQMLARDIGERSVRRPKGLHAAADRIETSFASSGLSPVRQTFDVEGVAWGLRGFSHTSA